MNMKTLKALRSVRRVALLALVAKGAILVGIGHSAATQWNEPESVSISDAPRTSPSASPAVQAVVRIGMTVGDLDRSVEFYRGVLGFQEVLETELVDETLERLTGVFGARVRIARLSLGDEELELTQYLAPEGRPIPPDSRSNDRWFQHIAIVVSDMDKAYAHLRSNKVRHASTGPQTLPQSLPNAAGIRAFYFKDPDGHVLEVIQFPPDKGDPRWRQASDRLFLGIDHTAIAVADTEASLRFFRDTLGLRVVGGSENYGTEQEHLNNVFGARLRITTLKATRGPGVELLEYLAPSGGRPYPLDSQANDLWHWQTTFTCSSIEACEKQLRETQTAWLSPGIVADTSRGKALTVRDPDGHALVVMSEVATREHP
jgi:catechol 2,3-dioxygenase-like lactoylglutathione lyase family enzyme